MGEKVEELLKPDQTAEMTKLTTAGLAQLRYTGKGPKYLKLTAKTIRYRESDVRAWLDASERTSTAGA